MQHRSGHVGWMPVVAVVVVSAVVRVWAARAVEAPWIFPDEMTYAIAGRTLWHSSAVSLLGGGTGGYSFLYPAIVGLPLSAFGPSSGLAVAQVLQAVAMSSVAVIVFAWGRAVFSERWALIAAVLSVCIPGLAYSGMLMTETVFYPAVTLALWALWRALVTPTLLRQGAFALAAGLAVLTRAQALALLPAAILAIAVCCAFSRDLTLVRRVAPLFGLVLVVGTAALGVATVSGSWVDIVGVYAAATGGYDLGAGAQDVFWHSGALFVIVAGAPLVALGILMTECVRRRESDAAAALVATTFAWTAISVVEVGIFASRWVDHIAERSLITVAPPLFLVLALWLARGAPRPQPATSVVALAVAVPAILLPVARFSTQVSALDAFSFIPLWRLSESTSPDALRAAYTVAVSLIVAACVLLRRRWAGYLIVGIVAATLASTSVVSSREIDRLARADRTWVFSTEEPGWIDDVADGPVTYVHARTAFPKALWQTLYWNERIDRVLQFDGTPPATPVPTRRVAPRVGGLVLDTEGKRPRAGYVVAPSSIVVAGAALATYGTATDMPGLTLWRADSPLSIRWMTNGVQPNGDIRGAARIQVLGCTQGHLSLTLLGKEGTPVRISVDGRPALTVTPPANSVWSGDVPAPLDADGTDLCVYEIDSPGLVGTTRIEFVET